MGGQNPNVNPALNSSGEQKFGGAQRQPSAGSARNPVSPGGVQRQGSASASRNGAGANVMDLSMDDKDSKS